MADGDQEARRADVGATECEICGNTGYVDGGQAYCDCAAGKEAARLARRRSTAG